MQTLIDALGLIYPWGEWVIAHKAESSALAIKSDSIKGSFKRLVDNMGTEKMLQYMVIATNLRV